MAKPEFSEDRTEGDGAYDRVPILLAQWDAMTRFKEEVTLFLQSPREGLDILEKIRDGEISINTASSQITSELDRIQKEVHNR